MSDCETLGCIAKGPHGHVGGSGFISTNPVIPRGTPVCSMPEHAKIESDLAAAKAESECQACRAKREARELVNGWLAGGSLDESTPKQWEATARMLFDELKDHRAQLAAAKARGEARVPFEDYQAMAGRCRDAMGKLAAAERENERLRGALRSLRQYLHELLDHSGSAEKCESTSCDEATQALAPPKPAPRSEPTVDGVRTSICERHGTRECPACSANPGALWTFPVETAPTVEELKAKYLRGDGKRWHYVTCPATYNYGDERHGKCTCADRGSIAPDPSGKGVVRDDEGISGRQG